MDHNIKNAEIRTISEQVIWKDRKHHLWFPLGFTSYRVADGRLYINTGLLSSREDECLLYRILDITLTRTLAQRLFGTGTILLNTRDQSTPVIRIENIARPKEVKRLLSDLIEKERLSKKIVGKDMYGASGHPGQDGDLDGDGIPDDIEY